MIMKSKPYISIILTKRCNAKCKMCNCHMNPSREEDEFSVDMIEKLPQMKNTTLTGGEPFLRRDINQIVNELQRKTERILINTNGYFTETICSFAKKNPNVGIRISIDGSEETHNTIRGVPNIYKHSMNTLNELIKIRGKHDIGIAFCVQDCNYMELFPMFEWANKRGLEFGFTVVQNASYFNKNDNEITKNQEIIAELEKLKKGYLKGINPRKWARAYFVEGAEKYVNNEPKPLKCDAGRTSFFVNPYGLVMPCNDFPQDMIMGDLKTQTWDEIMNSEQGKKIANTCENCSVNCWSICNMGSRMRKSIFQIGAWIITKKIS